MANRRFLPPLGALEVDVVELFAEITVAGGAVSAVSGKGIASATIGGPANLLTVILSDRYNKLLWASAVGEYTGASVVGPTATTTADLVNNATPSVNFQFRDTTSGATAAPADGKVRICIKVRNSSVA